MFLFNNYVLKRCGVKRNPNAEMFLFVQGKTVRLASDFDTLSTGFLEQDFSLLKVVVVWMAEQKCLDDYERLNSNIHFLMLTVKTYWGHDSVIGTVDSSISQHHLSVKIPFCRGLYKYRSQLTLENS